MLLGKSPDLDTLYFRLCQQLHHRQYGHLHLPRRQRADHAGRTERRPGQGDLIYVQYRGEQGQPGIPLLTFAVLCAILYKCRFLNFIAIQGINEEYQQRKTNQRNLMEGSERMPEQSPAEAAVKT